MKVEQMQIADLLVITPTVFEDDRGCFLESYNEASFAKKGIDLKFIQDNQSLSKKNVVRGLHFQAGPYAQNKLVRVLQGEILDVAVDIRKDSKTYGKYYSIVLSSENKKQLLVPKGFAHGFSVLSETAMVLYKVDEVYNKESERGIRYDDPALGIDWKVDASDIIISAKDAVLGTINQLD